MTQATQPKVLALDLEGTLISNAMSQYPRPGLFDFLTRCHELFERVVVFTKVQEPTFRPIAKLLADEGSAPVWFADVEYVVWKGNTKDLNFVHGAKVDEVILVDDHRDYVHPGQEAQWVEIACFDPSGEADDALTGTLTVLEEMLSAPTQYVPTPAP